MEPGQCNSRMRESALQPRFAAGDAGGLCVKTCGAGRSEARVHEIGGKVVERDRMEALPIFINCVSSHAQLVF